MSLQYKKLNPESLFGVYNFLRVATAGGCVNIHLH